MPELNRIASAPRRPSPARAHRRRLMVELALAAILAAAIILAAGGLGVVAFVAVPVLLVGLLTIAVERGWQRRRRPRRR